MKKTTSLTNSCGFSGIKCSLTGLTYLQRLNDLDGPPTESSAPVAVGASLRLLSAGGVARIRIKGWRGPLAHPSTPGFVSKIVGKKPKSVDESSCLSNISINWGLIPLFDTPKIHIDLVAHPMFIFQISKKCQMLYPQWCW